MYKIYDGLQLLSANSMYIMTSDIQNHSTRQSNYIHVSMTHSDLHVYAIRW